jgi:hypothetical protein
MSRLSKMPNEMLARFMYRVWSRWVATLLKYGVVESDGLKLPHVIVEQWTHQRDDGYDALSDEDKEQFLLDSRRILAIFLGDEE